MRHKPIDIENRVLKQLTAGTQSRAQLARALDLEPLRVSKALYRLTGQRLVVRTYGRFAMTKAGRLVLKTLEAA